MTVLTQEVQAKIADLFAAGKEASAIVKSVKMTKIFCDSGAEVSDLEAYIAELGDVTLETAAPADAAPAAQVDNSNVEDVKAPELDVVEVLETTPAQVDNSNVEDVKTPELDVVEVLETTETDTKLAQMVAAAEAAKAPEAQPAAATPKAKREPKAPVDPLARNLIVMYSEALKQCFITTRKSYANKTAEQVVERAHRRLGVNKPKLAALAAAADLQAEIVKPLTKGTDEVQAKIEETKKWAAKEGWTILSTCRKEAE